MLRRFLKRAAFPASAAAITAAMLVTGVSTASASTIPLGQIQLCSQGQYPSFIHILPTSIPGSGGATTPGLESPLVTPGTCWSTSFDTSGQWPQVDVVGIHSNGGQFWIKSLGYNSSVSGLGIGTEGDQSNPYVYTW